LRRSDPIRLVGFTRAVQYNLLGQVYNKAESGKINRVLELKGEQLSSSVWCSTWNCDTFPKSPTTDKFKSLFPSEYDTWLNTDDIYHNRLQRHFCAIDLLLSHKGSNLEESIELAWKILDCIHQDWRPDRVGRLDIRNLVNIKPLKRQKPETLDDELLRTNYRASTDCLINYNVLELTSVIPFMLFFGLESELPIHNLRKSFTLDLLSAAFVIKHLLFHYTNGIWINIGVPGKLCWNIPRFLLEDDPTDVIQKVFDDPIEGLEWYIDKMNANFDIYDKYDFLNELRESYLQIFRESHISTQHVKDILLEFH